MLHVNDRNTNDTKRKRSKVSHPVSTAQQNVRNQPPDPNPVDASGHYRKNDQDAPNKNDANDGGHRFGNFRKYYKFHPVDHRMPLLEPLLRHIVLHHSGEAAARPLLHKKKDTKQQKGESNDISAPIIPLFRYLDVGCNEGDLTLAVAERLQTMTCPAPQAVTKPIMAANVHVRGMDLDPLLIDRARAKVAAALRSHQPKNGLEHSTSSIVNRPNQITFETVNVLQDGIPPCEDTKDEDNDGFVADLTSLFSTTMWLHIHGGDDGLRRVLEQICQCTRQWILLEVQPSKCYGKAALRWRRKMMGGRGDHPPPLDVSPQRLQLRTKIDQAVEEMLQQHGFERVRIVTDEQSEESGRKIPAEDSNRGDGSADQNKDVELKTPWNRSCRLYTRVESLNKAKR